jgi:hypothetical protein
MIFCIGWVGVDFRTADQFKTSFERQLDHKVFANVASAGKRILWFISSTAMFFNAQNAARF